MSAEVLGHPTMADIARAQETESNLRRQMASRRFYRRAKSWQAVGNSLALVLALVSPVVFFVAPAVGPTLGAIAGLWIFLSRLVVVPLRDRSRQNGAAAQEMFDCGVLSLPWNTALVKPIAEEEIRSASGDAKALDSVRDWYPAEDDMPWPRSVITCQRSNAVWARRQHRAYGQFLVGTACAWFVFGGVIALVDHASLAAYLTTLALPSLPFLLDASDLARGHFHAARSRGELEEVVDGLLAELPDSSEQMREVQDQLFGLRKSAPLVPEWFYRLVASAYERDMKYAAHAVAEEAENGSDS